MKRVDNYVCRNNPKPWTYEAALKNWSIRYSLMCEYLDEVDAGNLEHLPQLYLLANIETSWCSYDARLREFVILGQRFHEDSEGASYESSDDVFKKVERFKEWLLFKAREQGGE